MADSRLTFCYCCAIESLEEFLLIFPQYSNGFSSRLFDIKAEGQRLYDFFVGRPYQYVFCIGLGLKIHADQNLGET